VFKQTSGGHEVGVLRCLHCIHSARLFQYQCRPVVTVY